MPPPLGLDGPVRYLKALFVRICDLSPTGKDAND